MKFTKIFLDGADIENVEKLSNESYISGFTSNPSLMTKSGITNYHDFILRFLSASNNKPVSFEVVSDDFISMEKEAYKINSYGDNIYVKIPITNSKGESSLKLIGDLLSNNLKINVTAILSQKQLKNLINILKPENDVIVSYRKDMFVRIKTENRTAILNAIENGVLRMIYNSNVTEIKKDEITLSITDAEGVERIEVVTNDLIYIFAGGELPTKFLRKAGVKVEKMFGKIVKQY